MTFGEALKAMHEGKKVRREAWPEGDFLDMNKFLNGRRRDASFADLLNDWEIVDEAD